MVKLSFDELLIGILLIIWVLFGSILGMNVIRKYKRTQTIKKITISTGLVIFFLPSPWWGGVIQFLSVLTTQNKIPDIMYVTISQIPGIITLIVWIYTYTTITFPKLLKEIMRIYILFGLLYEIYLCIGISIDFEFFIGHVDPVKWFDIKYRFVPIIANSFIAISMILVGIHIASISIRSSKKEERKNGYILLMSFISLSIGIILDSGLLDEIPDTKTWIILAILSQTFLVTGTIELYFGLFKK